MGGDRDSGALLYDDRIPLAAVFSIRRDFYFYDQRQYNSQQPAYSFKGSVGIRYDARSTIILDRVWLPVMVRYTTQ